MPKFYVVYRSVDSEIEFQGLRGIYFYYAAGAVIGSIFITILLYIVGVNTFITVLFLLIGAGGGVGYCLHANAKFGKWGHVKNNQKGNAPDFIIQSRSFVNIIDRQPKVKFSTLVKPKR